MRCSAPAVALAFALVAALGCNRSDVSRDATKTDPATSTAAPEPSPSSRPLEVELFDEPREAVVTRTVALSDAADLTTFSAWDGESMMLFDAATGDELNLGPGRYGVFSEDSRHVAWIAATGDSLSGEGWVMNLQTRERTSLGMARTVRFMSDGRLAIGVGTGGAEALDLATGVRTPVDAATAFNPPFPRLTQEGYELRQSGARETNGAYGSRWTVHGAGGSALLEFEALQATPAGPGWLAAATTPRTEGSPVPGERERGTVNIFLVQIATGRAEFVSTSVWSYANWPLVANAQYVIWTEDFCGFPDAGHTRIYNRTSQEIIEVDETLWLEALTDGGTLAVGAFGADALISLESLAYTVRLPDGIGDNAWSPDYRWASAGRSLGHGGLCP
jgi:hypothetical protein